MTRVRLGVLDAGFEIILWCLGVSFVVESCSAQGPGNMDRYI